MKHHEKLDIDIRFLLANERTLLAWLRTGLALQAGGAALLHFNSNEGVLGLSIIAAGGITAAIGYHHYKSADRAIRRSKLPRPGIGPLIEVLILLGSAVALFIIYLF